MHESKLITRSARSQKWQHLCVAFKSLTLLLLVNNGVCWQRIQKRMVLETCLGQFDVHKNTIIRTGESQALGGKYLEGVELDTMEECQRLCCETDNCDVYIFEAKNDGFCYLFECGPPENFHCKFTRHSNYTSAVLTKHDSLPAPASKANVSNVSQQEYELTSLKGKSAVAVQDVKAAENLSNMLTAKAQNNKPAQVAVTNLLQCGRFQFACHTGECIAVYNACDGIPQCADGSDEGPECSRAPAEKAYEVENTINKEVTTPKDNGLNIGNTVSEKQLRPLPPAIDNREDHNAWANRQIVAELQQQADTQSKTFEHKEKVFSSPKNDEVVPQTPHVVQVQPVYPRSGGEEYLPLNIKQAEVMPSNLGIQSQHATGQENVVLSTNQNWPHHTVINTGKIQDNRPKPQNLMPQDTQQQRMVQNSITSSNTNPVSQQQLHPPNLVVPQKVVVGSIEKTMKTSRNQNNIIAENESYEDYVEKSTEPPKKKMRKHKKEKTKSAEKLAIDVLPHKESVPQPHNIKEITAHQVLPPVHEQYKAIHESLAFEYRDHDGFSERPGGAIVSLTLGLLVTAVLAILFSCRMRTVRRRSRRPGGKSSYAHESDFLVNGMYL